MTLDAFLGHFAAVRKIGKNWAAQCPAHDDRSRNTLHVALGHDGRRLVICRAGCQINDVLRAAQLKAGDLFDDGTRPTRGSAPRRRIQAGSLEAELLEVRRRELDRLPFRALYPLSDDIRTGHRAIALARTWATARGDQDDAWQVLGTVAGLEADVFALEAHQDHMAAELRRR